MKLGKFLKKKAFSLIELMVAMGILSVLMLMMTLLLDQVQETWQYSESRISQFREARVAFDLMSKNIGQASLNTYWDLKDEDRDGIVDQYFRTSELHFTVFDAAKELAGKAGSQQPVGSGIFFQAPLGYSDNYRNLNNLFNAVGYFVAWGDDRNFRPSIIRSEPETRFRIFEFRPPAEANQVFADGAEERNMEVRTDQIFDKWYSQSVSGLEDQLTFEQYLNPLAKNVVTVVVSPRESISDDLGNREDSFTRIASNYVFDSNDPSPARVRFTQQLPPLVRITMIAIDESGGARLESEGEEAPQLFPETLFQNVSRYESDLQEATTALSERNLNYKIFSTLISIRSAKWSPGD
ncbi:MAG: Verru_Chthon cassette protein C [Verrucomicrobiales bacterium]|jgi:uncharacterized protein (TIGR02599 family)|nr:Verru_Chthon cassette protein C [Verrucomicrobiales bacterium]